MLNPILLSLGLYVGLALAATNTSGCLDFEKALINSQDDLRQLRSTTNRIADVEKVGLLEESELDAP
jgi:hypothetical protein